MSLSISPAFDFSRVSCEKDSEVHLDTLITAPEKTDEQQRTPLHIVLGIDCSGSMSGGKLDSVKSTVKKLIKHLTENDSLGIIGFSTNAWEVSAVLPMTKENKALAENALSKLAPMSSTNLSEAIAMCMEKAVISDKNKVSRIILLTDGLPTTGQCDKTALVSMAGKSNPTVSMTTFGYGDDFDAELMASISQVARGNSFYIQKDDDCNKAFALELGGLLSLYAQNLKITIVPSGNMEFLGLLSEYKCEQSQGYRLTSNAKIVIEIDDIYFGEKKHCILKLRVPKASEAVCARPTRVCDIEVFCTTVQGAKEEQKVSEAARINYVKDAEAQVDPDTEVKKQLAIIEVARIQKEAQESAKKGDLAGARGILAVGTNFVVANAVLLNEAAPSYQNMFQNLSEGYVDQHAYATKGVRLGASYSSSFVKNRATSADLGASYNTDDQLKMMASFSDPEEKTPDPKQNP